MLIYLCSLVAACEIELKSVNDDSVKRSDNFFRDELIIEKKFAILNDDLGQLGLHILK